MKVYLQCIQAWESLLGYKIGDSVQIRMRRPLKKQWVPAIVVGWSLDGNPIISRGDWNEENRGNRIEEVVKRKNCRLPVEESE